MVKKFLIGIVLLVVFMISGCETVKGTATGAAVGLTKDIDNTAVVACKTGETIADAFNPGDGKKPKGAVYKADDWIRENLW